MRFRMLVCAWMLACPGSAAWAAGVDSGGGSSGGGGSSEAVVPARGPDPLIKLTQQKIAAEDWLGAQELMRSALQTQPNNPDYHNLYAFALRKGPAPNMKLVFAEYAEALRLDPSHRGAREYLGEAYLQVGDLPKAREQLAALDKLCFLPCEEYSDLKKMVQEYEARNRQ